MKKNYPYKESGELFSANMTRVVFSLEFILLFLVLVPIMTRAQGVGISESSISPNASSILELRSTTRGLLFPRLTTTNRDAITVTGMTLYNSSTNTIDFYNSSSWITLAPLASPTFTGTVDIPTPFNINGVSMTSTAAKLNFLTSAAGTTGTTSTNLVYSTSPTLVSPVLGDATGTSLSVSGSLTAQATTNQLVLGTTNTTTLSATAPAASRVITFPDPLAAADVIYNVSAQTITGAKTFGSAGSVGKLIIAGNTSGTTILDATAVAGSGTVTLPTSGTMITTGVLLNIQVLTTTGTYTPTTGTKSAIIHLIGSGGGGGGAGGGTATRMAIGGAGGAGSYVIDTISNVINTYSYVVGALGAGGAAGANVGTAGGDVTFTHGGVTTTAKGGSGGAAGAQVNGANGRAGALGGTGSSNGLVLGVGQSGLLGFGSSNTLGFSGSGGSTILGKGGSGGFVIATTTNMAGGAATGYGSGGGGAIAAGASTAAGGNGSKGVIIVYEYK